MDPPAPLYHHPSKWSVRMCALKQLVLHWLKKLWPPFASPWHKPTLITASTSKLVLVIHTHTWRIDNFLQRYEDENERVLSTPFQPFDGFQFRAEIVRFHHDQFGFRAAAVESAQPWMPVLLRFDVLDSTGKCYTSSQHCVGFFVQETAIIIHDMLELGELLDPENRLIHNGALTIRCKVLVVPPSVTDGDEPVPLKGNDQFHKFLGDDKFANVKLVVAGAREFNAHKEVLAMRSVVLAKMIDQSETPNRLELPPNVDGDVFEVFLKYLYTGTVSSLDQMAAKLLPLAAKFQVNHLKLLCEQVLCANLSAVNVLENYQLGKSHGGNRLQTRSLDFIKRHIIERLPRDNDLLIASFRALVQEEVAPEQRIPTTTTTTSQQLDFSHVWRIENFAELVNVQLRKLEALESGTFTLPAEQGQEIVLLLRMRLYAKPPDDPGSTYCSNRRCSISLECFSPAVADTLYQISILDSSGQKRLTQTNYWHVLKDPFARAAWKGCKLFFENEDIFNPKNELLPGGVLTVLCEGQVITNNIIDPVTGYKPSQVKDFDNGDLWQDEKLADVVLVINGEELRCHKMVLMAGSPVFATMFDQDIWLEARQNRVEIPNTEVDVFSQLLEYLYTGKASKLEHYAQQLLPQADKYQVDALKDECAKYLASKLSVENALDLLKLARVHDAEQLETKARDFIIKKTSDTIKWRNVEQFLVTTYRSLAA